VNALPTTKPVKPSAIAGIFAIVQLGLAWVPFPFVMAAFYTLRVGNWLNGWFNRRADHNMERYSAWLESL